MKRLSTMASVGAVLLGLGLVVQAEEAKGTIKSVNLDRKEVVLKGLVNDTVYERDKGATVWLDGAQRKLDDFAAADRAVIVFEKRGEHLMASSVRGLRRAQETTGTVTDVIADKREVIVKGSI